jgi:hypothetical protein
MLRNLRRRHGTLRAAHQLIDKFKTNDQFFWSKRHASLLQKLKFIIAASTAWRKPSLWVMA